MTPSLERFAQPFFGALQAHIKREARFPLIPLTAVKIIIALFELKNIMGSFW